MRGLKFLEWVLITVVHSYLRLTQIMKKKIWKRVEMDTLVWSQESCFNWRLGGAAVVVMNRCAKLTGFISASCKYRDVFDVFIPY